MKKLFASAILFFFWTVPAMAAYDLEVTNFASNIAIQKDGLVRIEETINVSFYNPMHGIYRDMPIEYRNKDGSTYATAVSKISVTDGTAPVQFTTENNGANLRIKIGDPNVKITGNRTYVIGYTVSGALKSFNTYDELYWNATGNDWIIPIDRASANVTLPESGIIQMSCYYGPYGSKTQCESGETSSTTAQFAVSSLLSPGDGMTVALGFTKGMVPIHIPVLKAKKETFHTLVFLFSSFLLTMFFGIVIPFWLWWTKGRDKKRNGDFVSPLDHESIIAEYEPPLGLRPGEIGTLIDETADTLDVTATIVDLASRGFITITEIPKSWIFGSTDYELALVGKFEGVLEHERLLLVGLSSFGIREGDIRKVKVSELRESFYTHMENIKKSLYNDLTNKQLFDGNPQDIRLKYILYGFATIGVGFAEIFIAGESAVLVGVGFGIIISGILFSFIAKTAMPRRTAQGHDAYLKALGYKLFISNTEKYRAKFYEKENMFVEILPYAIVFGVTKKLAEAMKEMGIQPPEPSWYHGVNAFNAAIFATNMGDLSGALSTAIASAPGGSGSGGGGSSGGGGGGGGGGGW